jgi:CRP/FNR family transcriptional regulator, anaerobic regulatory protein
MELKKIEQQLLQIFDSSIVEEIIRVGQYHEFMAGEEIMRPGQYIKAIPFILSGLVKIMREDAEGKELLLYYLGENDSCAMSLTCCMALRKSEVRAIAEEQTQILMIPVEFVEQWMEKYPGWKSFVFGTYQKRFEEMLSTIDNIAFKKMDERLLDYLEKKSETLSNNSINITHEEIARNLGTSREVVSRLLKQLERMGEVKLSRNKIELLS